MPKSYTLPGFKSASSIGSVSSRSFNSWPSARRRLVAEDLRLDNLVFRQAADVYGNPKSRDYLPYEADRLETAIRDNGSYARRLDFMPVANVLAAGAGYARSEQKARRNDRAARRIQYPFLQSLYDPARSDFYKRQRGTPSTWHVKDKRRRVARQVRRKAKTPRRRPASSRSRSLKRRR